MAMLYVKTAKQEITAYPIEPGKIFVGQEDLFDILSLLKELEMLQEQAEADDWADNGFDDGL